MTLNKWNIHFRAQNNKDDIRGKSIPGLNMPVEKGSNTPCEPIMQKIHEETFCPAQNH